MFTKSIDKQKVIFNFKGIPVWIGNFSFVKNRNSWHLCFKQWTLFYGLRAKCLLYLSLIFIIVWEKLNILIIGISNRSLIKAECEKKKELDVLNF